MTWLGDQRCCSDVTLATALAAARTNVMQLDLKAQDLLSLVYPLYNKTGVAINYLASNL